MSTYFYYRCLQHDPPLECGTAISQHDDQYVEMAIRRAAGEPEWKLGTYPWMGDWVRYPNEDFLRFHAACPMDVVNEYGESRPIPGREKPDA